MKDKQDPKKWEVLKSEYLFRRPWLTARRDHVRLPDGVENPEYYVLEYPRCMGWLCVRQAIIGKW